MKRFTFFLVAVATMAGLVTLIAPAPGHADGQPAPPVVTGNPSWVPRLEVDFLGPRSRQP